jgi:hypothetical protein
LWDLVVVVLPFAYVYYAYSGAACHPGSMIWNETEAVARAKQIIAQRGLFYFEGVGGTKQILKRLDEQPNCCGASKLFEVLRLASTWQVSLGIGEAERPYYHMQIEMTFCGNLISTGKMIW